ncbi:MAG: T9SS type A sorting domain-containing protein [Bacteroidales bacterium]|nr:T9SS type A sorting domain-containing protein [Bacteroidales bacterium]
MKKLLLFISLSMVYMFANAQAIEKSYSFGEPMFTQIRGHEQIQLDGCMQSALIGQPSLPWQSVSLLLPEGQEAETIEVILSDFVELEGEHNLFPYQPSRTTGDVTPRALVKDEALYASKDIYPIENHGVVTTQYRNGYGFAFSAFTPVQYIPATGKVMMAKKALVKVHTTAAKASHSDMLWGTEAIKSSVRRLAQNPEMVESYQTRGREVTVYDMLIITGADYVEAYNEYRDYYNGIGLRNRIISVNDIYSTMTGIDNQAKIRNYIIQEYQNNGITMVVLGGDVAIVPYRGLYCYVTSGGGDQESNNIPADLYYCGLDGTWNDNGNSWWGEIGEDDLLPEVGISRMSFNNVTELNNMVHKTLSYQQNPVMGEFRNIVLGGEHLYDNPESNGSDYLELIIGTHDDNGYTTVGYPEDYNFTRLYEENGTWGGSALRNAINNGVGFVHHNGHANSGYVAGWYGISNSDFSGANGVTHNYTFLHSQGCDAAAFDENSIMEKMTTIENFAVAIIGNSRYGWFNEGQTEGPGTHLEREMVDAQWSDCIADLGCALSESKCATAPWVTAPGQWEEGALRWNFYDIHVLGDGAVNVWLDEPYTASVDYPAQVILGVSSFEVSVTDADGQPLKNFRCLVFLNDEAIAMGFTDEDGVAEVTFADGSLQQVGEMTMKVTGAGSYPQSFSIMAVPSNTPYVVYESYALSDEAQQIEFNGSYALDLTLKNVGNIDASNVVATISCESEYITLTENTATVGDVDGNQAISLENVFPFTVSDAVPNNTLVRFDISCTDGTDTWNSYFKAKVYAPEFELVDISTEAPSGNAVMPGDNATLHFTFRNSGNAAAPSAVVEVFNSHAVIDASVTQWNLESIAPGAEVVVDMPFTLSDDAQVGVVYELPYTIYHGNYILESSYYLAVGQTMDGFESGNFSAFDWQQGSVISAWEVVSQSPYEGQYCAKSSAIDHGESSVLSITLNVSQEGEASFYYKVSSESGWDKLYFYIDDNEQNNWSGEVSWTQATYTLPVGTHTLKWEYRKDYSVSSGDDCAWIDNVVFPPVEVITEVQETAKGAPVLYPNPNSGSFRLELADEPCQIAIYNNVGQLVYKQDNASGTTTLNLQGLSSGMYFIQMNSASSSDVVKFVKE